MPRPKLKRFSMNGSAEINFNIELNAKSAKDAWDRASEFDLQDILDNGVVTVDELQLEEAVVVVAQ